MRVQSVSLALAALPLAIAQKCSPLHLIYARATTEPPTGVDNANARGFEAAAARTWSKGYGAAGHSLYTNITALIPSATGWPVHYPASWSGCTSEDKGVADILNQITTMAKACPSQKYVLGGHSQGGVVTVRAIPLIPNDILPRVLAVTMFGSPNCPSIVKDRCRSYCNKGDGICTGTGDAKSKGRCTNPKLKIRSLMEEVVKEPLSPAAEAGESAAQFERALQDAIQNPAADAKCSGPEVEEKGHVAKSSKGAHLAYNADGYYTRAAACYIYNQFKASTK